MWDLGGRVEGVGCRVQGVGLERERVWGVGLRVLSVPVGAKAGSREVMLGGS